MNLELANYLLEFYADLLTPEDARVLRAAMFADRLRASRGGAAMKQALIRIGELNDLQIELALAGGVLEARMALARRIWSEHGGEIVLNLCPGCGGLARSPRARQCPHCHHSWHDADRRGGEVSHGTVGGCHWASFARPWEGKGQDRWGVFGTHYGIGVVVADGAGNSSAGTAAADAIVEGVRGDIGATAERSDEWSVQESLLRLDEVVRLTGGESTALAIVLTDTGIVAAAAGDTVMCARTKAGENVWFPRPRTRYRLGTGCADVNVLCVDGATAALIMTDGAFHVLGTHRSEQVLMDWRSSAVEVTRLATEIERIRQNVGDDVTLVVVSRNIQSA